MYHHETVKRIGETHSHGDMPQEWCARYVIELWARDDIRKFDLVHLFKRKCGCDIVLAEYLRKEEHYFTTSRIWYEYVPIKKKAVVFTGNDADDSKKVAEVIAVFEKYANTTIENEIRKQEKKWEREQNCIANLNRMKEQVTSLGRKNA